MATGSTGLEEIKTYDETFVMKEENGEIKLSIKGYIGNEKVDRMYEDDNLKIMIDEVEINYETVTYKMKVRNKIDDIIVLEDGSEKYEIVLDTNGQYRRRNGFFLEPVVIYPYETKNFELTYVRFYDEAGDINKIIFNDIRILKSYTGTEETREDELNNATERYSVVLNMNDR